MLENYINKIIKFAFKAFKAKKHTDLLPLSSLTETNIKSQFFPAVVDCKVHNYKAQSEYSYPSQNFAFK